jgi:small subunit ribosomal protein S14
MAKKSSIEKNNRRRRMAKKFSGRRARLKDIVQDKTLPVEERFAASLKLAELPRNSSATRIRNRCEETVAHRAAGARLEGPDPGPGQVELVRRIARCQ